MHGVVGRRHAIVNNGVDDGVIVYRDAGEATGLIIDAIVTIYASGAAGNGDGGSGKVPMWNARGGQKQESCVERRSVLDPRTESDTVTDTPLLSLSLASF